MEKYYAANFIFNGKIYIKNGCLHYKNGQLINIGAEGSGFIEHERMIFYNGILCPFFPPTLLDTNASLTNFLTNLKLNFNTDSTLPIILLENIDLQNMAFTTSTNAQIIW